MRNPLSSFRSTTCGNVSGLGSASCGGVVDAACGSAGGVTGCSTCRGVGICTAGGSGSGVDEQAASSSANTPIPRFTVSPFLQFIAHLQRRPSVHADLPALPL